MEPTENQIHAILDTARFGDHITVTRSNGGDLTATVSGPVLAVPYVSPAVAIDLMDGVPHIIRSSLSEVFGHVTHLALDLKPLDDEG